MVKNPKIFKNLWSLEESLVDLISSFCSSATAGKHGVCIINNVHYLLHISQLKWERHGDKSFISTYKCIHVPVSLYTVASGLFSGSLETSSPKTQMFCFFPFCLLDFKVGACARHERCARLRPYCRWVCWRCGGHLEGQLASDLQPAVIYLNLIFILLRGLQWPLTPGLSITSTPCIGVPLCSCSSEASYIF